MPDVPRQPDDRRFPLDARFHAPTPFARLVVAHALSTCADACFTASLAGSLFFAKPGDSARGSLLLYLLLTMAPFAIVAPIMGPALDRIRGGRRLMVILADIGRGLLCLVMAQFILKPSPEGLLLYPLAFGLLVLSKTYSIARSALVPALVEDEAGLVRANSRLALISLIMGFVGGGPAFLLQAVFDARWSLWLAMLVFGAATVAAIRIPRTKIVQGPAERELENEELHQPSVLLAGSATAVVRGAVGFVVFFAAFAFHDHKIGLVVFGLAYAAGNFGGNIVAPVLRERFREETLLASALGTAAGLVVLGSVAGGVLGFGVAGLGVALCSASGRLGFDSLLQRDGREAARGRAFARFETRFQFAWVVGALFGLIPANERVGLLVLGLVLASVAASYYGALRVTRGRPARTTVRPQAVDRAFDRARSEIRERRRRSRGARRRSAATRRVRRPPVEDDEPDDY